MDEPREIGEWIAVSELGSGSFGVVKLWKNKGTNEFIAVKKCRFNQPTQMSQKQRERWTNEVKIMRSIKNENIVAFKDLPDALNRELSKYNSAKLPLLSMEYCSRGNLRICLQQLHNARGMRETEVRCVLGDMCNAVSYLHGLNVTHRDIKPENIVVQETSDRPNRSLYKLIDLGYAKELETLVQSFVGTLHYLAPEIFKTENYNSNVDYWSLGIVAFEIITGVLPFLHQLAPVERFEHIEKKSPDVICIRISKNGTKSFDTIALENHIGHAFKTHMESWLKLVLQFDPKMRGVRDGKTVDVFRDLKGILEKKIIKVFSVYNYEYRTYEIVDSTSISDLKKLIERDLHVSEGEQVFLTEKIFPRLDDGVKIIDCFMQINHESTVFVLKKAHFIESKVIALPDMIKVLLDQNVTDKSVLKQIYKYALDFISREDELLLALKAAFSAQIARLEFFFAEEAKSFLAVRNSLQKLVAQIEFLAEMNQKFLDVVDVANEKCSLNLIRCRTYLRQSKELIENVNSLTERHLMLLEKRSSYETATANLKSLLNEIGVKQLYLDALKVYELSSRELSIQEMSKIVLNVIKVKFKTAKNEVLKDYIALSMRLTRKCEKLFIWMEALEKNIGEISNLLSQNICDRYDLICDKSVEGSIKKKQKLRMSFHDGRAICDTFQTERLVKENIQLRYSIQDLVINALAYHRIAADIISDSCNGV